MADEKKKTVLKEINLWKKRYLDSRKVFKDLAKDLQKDARKFYKDVIKQIFLRWYSNKSGDVITWAIHNLEVAYVF